MKPGPLTRRDFRPTLAEKVYGVLMAVVVGIAGAVLLLNWMCEEVCK